LGYNTRRFTNPCEETLFDDTPRRKMEELFSRIAAPECDSLEALTELVSLIRPIRKGDFGHAEAMLKTLTQLIQEEPEFARVFREFIQDILSKGNHLTLYVDAGIFSNTGFVGEIRSRISHKILPEVPRPDNLQDIIGILFEKPSDGDWVNAVKDETFLSLLNSMIDEDLRKRDKLPHAISQILESLQILSYRISSLGLEPELVRVDPSLAHFASPFLAQNVEMLSFIASYQQTWGDEEANSDDKHMHVLLDQCRSVMARVKKLASNNGTSINLTFNLVRLKQHIDRAEMLLHILEAIHDAPSKTAVFPYIVKLFKQLVLAECRKNDLTHYVRQNISIIALRIADHSGKKGEHYISSNRSEYFAMAKSALLGGLIICFMSAFKILLSYLHAPPLTEALLFCLNYGLGFVFIHIIGGTVASKQPAMTANAIAGTIGDSTGKGRDLEALTTLVARTSRSQLVAIIGNIGVAMPLAMIISAISYAVFGLHIATPAKATALLKETHPLLSGAVFYAGIAGFWLFLSGLIGGYYDNVAAYSNISQRIQSAKWIRRVLGARLQKEVAQYIHGNLGALISNFAFGFMLGGSYAIGSLFGIPFDIRHIAFSSAFVGFGVAGKGMTPAWGELLPAFVGVGLIGFMNVAVSFTLALMVALRARQVSFAQRRQLLASIAKRLKERPRDFFLPPKVQ